MPNIEVWYNVNEDGRQVVVRAFPEIELDATSPTQITILNGGATSGFIRLAK